MFGQIFDFVDFFNILSKTSVGFQFEYNVLIIRVIDIQFIVTTELSYLFHSHLTRLKKSGRL